MEVGPVDKRWKTKLDYPWWKARWIDGWEGNPSATSDAAECFDDGGGDGGTADH